MRRTVRFTLNGERVEAQVAPHETLVEVLRDAFGLYGARESCGQGLCGCCTIVVDGTAVSGCLYLATLADGAHVQTVEEGSELDAVQEAFIERAAFQCGFCTPGFVLMTRQLLAEHPERGDGTCADSAECRGGLRVESVEIARADRIFVLPAARYEDCPRNRRILTRRPAAQESKSRSEPSALDQSVQAVYPAE